MVADMMKVDWKVCSSIDPISEFALATWRPALMTDFCGAEPQHGMPCHAIIIYPAVQASPAEYIMAETADAKVGRRHCAVAEGNEVCRSKTWDTCTAVYCRCSAMRRHC